MAVASLGAEYYQALGCVQSEIGVVDPSNDLAESLSGCAETDYVNADAEQLAGARSDDNTWIASIEAVGDRTLLEFASASYGQIDGVTGAIHWAVVCWSLEVDETQREVGLPTDTECGAVADALCPPKAKEFVVIADLPQG
ncbi:hypothetical protein EXU48_13405 [Occultella glacieicola]|uniref:Uncharacterized protein n=1 Tax=Occultella glacieicola TaxID=2518684 RepID=A0ABY2E307_9MICO|nr:hypothetical protein [Occultella glacieicola]TDE92540.1 hypothetical protein EXU48_13405 [Occultella glacieicola]